jgi:hypothetical protein
MIGSPVAKQAHFKQLIHPIAPPVPIVLPPAKGMTLTMMGVG